MGDSVRLDNIRQELRDIFDMERLITRIVYGLVTPREMRSLQFTAQKLPQLKQTVGEVQSVYLTRLLDGMDTLEDNISSMIECAISDDPPALLKDGGVIRTGYNEELDSLREIVHNTKGVLTALESRGRGKNSGFKNLKVGFNNVFGYYIEVTRSFSVTGAARICSQTDADRQRAVYHPGAKGAGAADSGCKGPHPGVGK